MYHVYIKKESSWSSKQLVADYSDFDKACDKVEAMVEKNPDVKYVIEETTGAVDGLGELIAIVVKEN